MTNTIDMTPTWGEIGNVFRRFVESRETKAAMAMAPEIAKALAAVRAQRRRRGPGRQRWLKPPPHRRLTTVDTHPSRSAKMPQTEEIP